MLWRSYLYRQELPAKNTNRCTNEKADWFTNCANCTTDLWHEETNRCTDWAAYLWHEETNWCPYSVSNQESYQRTDTLSNQKPDESSNQVTDFANECANPSARWYTDAGSNTADCGTYCSTDRVPNDSLSDRCTDWITHGFPDRLSDGDPNWLTYRGANQRSYRCSNDTTN